LAKSQNTQQVVCVTELEEANASLRAELEAARTKLVEVEHHELTLTSKNEGLKRVLEGACSAREATVKEKELVQHAKQAKLQRFQDTIRKRLANLRRDTEASVATLGGQSSEFLTGASMLDFFKWFQKEIK
jgi:predicted Holliday junction resolvase-like endonuclease